MIELKIISSNELFFEGSIKGILIISQDIRRFITSIKQKDKVFLLEGQLKFQSEDGIIESIVFDKGIMDMYDNNIDFIADNVDYLGENEINMVIKALKFLQEENSEGQILQVKE